MIMNPYADRAFVCTWKCTRNKVIHIFIREFINVYQSSLFFLYLHTLYFRQRDQEYTRRTKIKMMSSRNAGVYVDTTTQEKLFQDDNFTFTGPDYRALQTFKTSYDDDSDEELWTSKMRG